MKQSKANLNKWPQLSSAEPVTVTFGVAVTVTDQDGAVKSWIAVIFDSSLNYLQNLDK